MATPSSVWALACLQSIFGIWNASVSAGVRGFWPRLVCGFFFFFFSSRRRHTRSLCDWSSDVCSSDLIADFDAPEGRRIALVPHGGTPLPELELGGDIVFVLGAERDGLPDEVLARCDVQASIPQQGGESLNVAMAGTIALYERARTAGSDPASGV